MINNKAMPVLLSARRVATHHRSSNPTVNDFAGALAPDACSHEDTMCAECRRDGWSDYYVEGRDVPTSLR